MNNPSLFFDGASRGSDRPDPVRQHREDWRRARAARADLTLMGMPRVNLLLKGRVGVIHSLIGELLPDLRDPIARWRAGEQLVLPQSAATATLILQDVDLLTAADQQHLLEWLESAVGRTQVVSTTSAQLLPRVENGTFLESLYYRLNVVCLDVTD